MEHGRWARATIATLALVVASCSGGGDDADRDADRDTTSAGDPTPTELECAWPMFGHGPARSFAYPCESAIDATSATRLTEAWFVNTRDVVTATPAVVDDTVFVGDWSGRFYALDLERGEARWTYDARVHPRVYSGQIVASPAVADVGDDRLVFFASGKTMYALDAANGDVQWEHEVGEVGDDTDPTEIQSSPVVVGDTVIFGFDGHDEPGVRAGLLALDAASGDERWYFDPDQGGDPTGCAGIWSSPTVDVERGLVFAGTANCVTSPEGWGPYTEALVAVDLETGAPKWSYQPHAPNNDDFDFAGAPNLFSVDGRDLVGLGNKDGSYYAVDRETGELVWTADAAEVRVPGRNFSTGGFIGATAVADGVIVGGTAVGGPCPCVHGIDAATGELRWQEASAGPTFAPTTIVNDVAFVGSTTDFTLRAMDVDSGAVVWSQEMTGGVAGGVAVVDDTIVAVAGIREPGLDERSETSGVTAFRLGDDAITTTTSGASDALPPSTPAPPPEDPPVTVPGGGACSGAPCSIEFGVLKEIPAGASPTMTLLVRPDPFRLEVRGDGLGEPDDWLRAGGRAAEIGAVTYGVFLTKSDDDPRGTLVCVLDGAFDCVTDVLPDPLEASYSRLSLLAIANTVALPETAEGFDRLVATIAFDPPLVLG
ncbi:MAG TPA: PQQ-binding-like beta-propeller repeat protein [Acidimicrobiia bacterium]|nr:PQQ-binding-like beta-propeller repeat protein [Acidimicrobiia bacterium]